MNISYGVVSVRSVEMQQHLLKSGMANETPEDTNSTDDTLTEEPEVNILIRLNSVSIIVLIYRCHPYHSKILCK